MDPIKRRTFIKNSTLSIAGMTIASPYVLSANMLNNEQIRIGFIGTGGRGRAHVNNILQRNDVSSPAFCDIDPVAVKKNLDIYKNTGKKGPKVYSDHEYAYRDMLEKENLDAVIISTPWIWHTPMVLDAMNAGIYVGVEVSGATSVDECWEWVNVHEQTGTPLMFLENVCYRRDVMAVLNMVRNNVFGEMLHCRCGYQHDLRHVKFNVEGENIQFGKGAKGEARWRTEHSLKRNGDLYPTHGLGPVSTMLNINRGNRLVSLTSHATKSRSLNHFIKQQGGKNHPYAKLDWELGDIVTSTVTTANGETIIVTHDTNLPRPYSLGFRVQGVKGLIEFDYGTKRVYVEGESDPHQWGDAADWLKKYDHPVWKKHEKEAEGSGHGGMDFFLDRAFVESVKNNEAPPLDVYDAAALKVITPLSENSIREGGTPQNIPDFTRGKWMNRKPIFGI